MFVAKLRLTSELEIVTPLAGVTAKMVEGDFGATAKAKLVAEIRKEMEEKAAKEFDSRLISLDVDVTFAEV